ncbi:MAG: tripartite tricarboxylate transporter substrate binding protein [Burkholderiales bacterium]|nr:tripartite tricarboxylate transporter substrate binding protein [Burkholderiales bacterium]
MQLIKQLGAAARLACALAGALAAAPALAQYPAKSVRVMVPYAPGGGTDILARLFAQKLTEAWGQSVVVENRPGADGVIGSEVIMTSPPDGHNLMLVVAAHVINPFVKSKVPFDVVRDFTPVTLVAASPWVVVVNPAVPAASVKELIAHAKANPGKLSFGSSEPSSRLAGEQFKQQAGINLLHVPYKGGSQIMTDLLGGHIQVGFTSVLTVLQHYKSGKLRVLGVGGRVRSPSMPDIPTVIEGGLPGYETSAWYGMYGPAGMPADVTARIQREIARIVRLPDVAERLTQLGAIAVANTPEEFAAFTRAEHAKYGRLVKDAGMQPE